MGRICPCREFAESRQISVALAKRTAFERDNWSPRHPAWRSLGHFHGRFPHFRHLLRDSEQVLAPRHFAPDVLGPHTRRRPKNREIVEQVGALADHRFGIAVDGVDHDLDGFLCLLYTSPSPRDGLLSRMPS